MHADVAREAFEFFGEREQLGDFLLLFFAFPDERLDLAGINRLLVVRIRAAPQRHRAAGLERDQLRELVAEAVREVEHAAYVPHHRLRRHGAEGGDLRDAVGAVPALYVIDHPIAPVLTEIDVEVRHGDAFRVEEALEQQVVAQRIEIGDAQRIGDERTGARAASRAHRHAVPFRPVDEVGDDQEVAREPHLHDGRNLEPEPLLVTCLIGRTHRLVGIELLQPPAEPGDRTLCEVILQPDVVGCRKHRQPGLAKFEREIAAYRDLDAIGERCGNVVKQRGHFRLGLEVLIGAETLRAPLVGKDVTFGDAHPRLVRAEVVGRKKLHRVRRHHRQLQLGRKPHCLLHAILDCDGRGAGRAIGQPLQLEVVTLREQCVPAAGKGTRLRPVAGDERLPHVAEVRTRKRDEPFGADFGEPTARNFGASPILVAAIGPAQEIAQAQIAFARLAQKQQTVGLVAITIVGDPDVAAGQGLQPLAARLLVELDEAKNVGEVGQRQRRHAVLRRRGHRLVEADDPVHDRVLAVQPQVDERRVHPRILRRAAEKSTFAA